MLVAPASSEFSRISFSADAGRCITCCFGFFEWIVFYVFDDGDDVGEGEGECVSECECVSVCVREGGREGDRETDEEMVAFASVGGE
jgi:hypothetical protein